MRDPRKVTVRGVDYWRSAKEMAAKGDIWPRHADGRPKKMGEMTSQQRKNVLTSAVERVGLHFQPEPSTGSKHG